MARIRYEHAADIKEISEEIIKILEWNHIHLEHIAFLRSFGSSAKRTIARCHALGKAMQIGMEREKGFYLVEVISEHFDRLPEEERIKVIIHELMHIPKSFGGGFIHHDKVHEKSVEIVFRNYCNLKQNRRTREWF